MELHRWWWSYRWTCYCRCPWYFWQIWCWCRYLLGNTWGASPCRLGLLALSRVCRLHKNKSLHTFSFMNSGMVHTLATVLPKWISRILIPTLGLSMLDLMIPSSPLSSLTRILIKRSHSISPMYRLGDTLYAILAVMLVLPSGRYEILLFLTCAKISWSFRI